MAILDRRIRPVTKPCSRCGDPMRIIMVNGKGHEARNLKDAVLSVWKCVKCGHDEPHE